MNKTKDYLNINLGQRIKTFRLLNHLTVKEMQTCFYQYNCHISRQTIYHWESNNATPSLSSIIILCEIFNISTSAFLDDISHNKPNMARSELNFLQTFRNNNSYKRLIMSLYNKEVVKNDKNRKKA